MTKLTGIFALVLSLTLSTSAFALKVGDIAKYGISNGGQNYEMLFTVASIDAAKDTFTFNRKVTQGAKVLQESVEASYLSETESQEGIFADCLKYTDYNPKFETITVTAGKMSVCHLQAKQNGSLIDAYFGQVAFALVKQVEVDVASGATTTVVELLEHKKN